MKLINVVVGMIFISIIVTGSTLFLGSLGDNYGVDYGNETLNKTKYETEQYLNVAHKTSEIITNITLRGPLDVILVPYDLIKAGWGVGKLVFESWDLVTAVISDIGGALTGSLGVSGTIVAAVTSIFVLGIVFILIYAFFKWRFDDKGT